MSSFLSVPWWRRNGLRWLFGAGTCLLLIIFGGMALWVLYSPSDKVEPAVEETDEPEPTPEPLVQEPVAPVPSMLMVDRLAPPASFPKQVLDYRLMGVDTIEGVPNVRSYSLARYESEKKDELRVRLVGLDPDVGETFRQALLQALTAGGEVLVETLPESLDINEKVALLSKDGAGILVAAPGSMVITISAFSPEEAARTGVVLLETSGVSFLSE